MTIRKRILIAAAAALLSIMAYGQFEGPAPPCIPKPGQTCPVISLDR